MVISGDLKPYFSKNQLNTIVKIMIKIFCSDTFNVTMQSVKSVNIAKTFEVPPGVDGFFVLYYYATLAGPCLSSTAASTAAAVQRSLLFDPIEFGSDSRRRSQEKVQKSVRPFEGDQPTSVERRKRGRAPGTREVSGTLSLDPTKTLPRRCVQFHLCRILLILCPIVI